MRKTLFVICHAQFSDCEPLERTLAATGISRLDLGLGHNRITDGLSDVLNALLANHGVELDRSIPDGWACGIQSDFEELLMPALQLFLKSESHATYIASTANAFLIDLWRAVCAELDLTIRFLYVRRFAWADADSSNAMNCLVDFNVATAVIRQYGMDVLCFDVADWRVAAEAADRAVWKLIQGEGVSASLPAQALMEGLKTEPRRPASHLPYELQIITDLFAGQHFGAPLMRHGNREDLNLVCRFAACDSAIFYLLSDYSSYAGRSYSGKMVEKKDTADIRNAWQDLVFDLKERLDAAETTIREFQAVDHDTRKGGAVAQQQKAPAKNTPPTKPKNPSVVVKKNVSPTVMPATAAELTSFERKWRKFRRDPALFFADAKNPMVRGVGGLFWRKP